MPYTPPYNTARAAHGPPSLPSAQVIGNKYETYVQHCINGKKPADSMNELGLNRYCCRRMVLTHVNLVDKLLAYHSFTRKAGDVGMPGGR